MIRGQIQVAIDEEADKRPLVGIARTLQNTFGSPQELDEPPLRLAAGSAAADKN
jgi:hypothetical protein